MPNQKKGKNGGKGTDHAKRGLTTKDDDHEYGVITKKLGGGKFLIRLHMQTKEVIGRLCGKLKYKGNKKQNYAEVDSVVLVGMRDFQDNVVDIVQVYSHEEANRLKKMGEYIEEIAEKDNNDTIEEANFDFDDI